MHKNNINKVQVETVKIIRETEKIIESLIEIENKIKLKDRNKEKTLSYAHLIEHQEMLKNEKQKLDNLEYVVAVVGTMKAGKSMTINAIVGQEVLPSREFPMTTLPTLITHKPQQEKPILSLKNIEPFEKLVKEIKEKIETSKTSEQRDLNSLIDKIKNSEISFKNSYEGQEKIESFLKQINDLMRIAKDFDIEPPYNDFTDVDDLPRIEVEFYHLSKEENSSNAKLTLLDTPGPDEFKHSTLLKEIFKNQLQRASAVMLLVDYTKMNSQSDVEVKEQVKEVANMIGKQHLFVLLNKFDQRKRSDDVEEKKEEAKRLIAEDVLKGQIDTNKIYPISAKSAFYANFGLRELDKNGEIDTSLHWIDDFGDEVLGRRWEKYINDNEEVIEACNEAWEDSFFEEPLENIITTIYSDALVMALNSHLTKVGSILDILTKGLHLKKNAYIEDIEELQDKINDVKNEISNIERISEEIKKIANDQIIKLKTDLEEESKKNIKLIQEDYSFEIDKKIKSIYSKIKENATYKPKIGEGEEVFGGKIKKKISEQLKKLEKEGILELESKKEAKEIINIFNKLLEKEVENFYLSAEEKLNSKIVHISDKLNHIIKENLGNTLHKIEEKFGSDFIIDLPQIELGNHNMNHNIPLEDICSSDKKPIYKKSKKLYKKILGWFNTDWEFDKEYVDVYPIKKAKVQEEGKEVLEKALNELNNLIDNTVTNKIDKKLNSILDILLTDIEGYCGIQEDVLIARQNKQIDIDKELLIVENFLALNEKLSSRREIAYSMLHKGKNNEQKIKSIK